MRTLLSLPVVTAALLLGGLPGSAQAATVDTASVETLVNSSQDCAYMGGETMVQLYNPDGSGTVLVRIGNPLPHVTSVSSCRP